MNKSTLEGYILQGLSAQDIADKEKKGKSTIRYWLKKFNLKTAFDRNKALSVESKKRKSIWKTNFNRKTDIKKYNWVEIQNYYDIGNSHKEVCLKFNLNLSLLQKAKKLGVFKSRSIGDTLALKHKLGIIDYSVYRTDEFRKNAAKNGGYKKGAGRCKGSWRSNLNSEKFYLQSSYEVKMAEILNSLGVIWIRPNPIKYFDSKIKNYYPDFYIQSRNLFIDTKNDYLIKCDDKKINLVESQNNIKIHIFDKNKINKDYVENFLNNS